MPTVSLVMSVYNDAARVGRAAFGRCSGARPSARASTTTDEREHEGGGAEQ